MFGLTPLEKLIAALGMEKLTMPILYFINFGIYFCRQSNKLNPLPYGSFFRSFPVDLTSPLSSS